MERSKFEVDSSGMKREEIIGGADLDVSFT